MKQIFLSLLILCWSASSFAQSPDFKTRYDKLVDYLESENWSKAESLCKDLLKYAEASDSMQQEKKVLRYIYIYTTAGLLNEKKINKDQALKRTIYLKGLEMVMPAHPFNNKCYENCIHRSDQDNDSFFTGVNNHKATQIFSIEYLKVETGIKETDRELDGKFIVLSGTLNEISVEGYGLPRFRLKFINGSYQVFNP